VSYNLVASVDSGRKEMKNLAAEVGVDINSFAPTASQQAWPVLAHVIRHCFERRGRRRNETRGRQNGQGRETRYGRRE
jgi:hypothetical protein